MSNRKEEERNERIIRGLMKLPPNRRCINCNSLGPQYVCTNFWTFVCMTCSGIHREFTHRVKSVSMSKFTSQEVEALQEGGNQRARETFLKDWDPRGQRLPDNSNVDKVREFIKSVYVDKKFFASKASGKPPRDIMNLRNHEDETRRASSYHSYSQSPPYDYQYEERRYGKQAPVLTKKPGSDRGMLRFLSTSRLSDHGQEDRFANEVSNPRVSDYSASRGGDPFRSDTQSPTSQRGFGFSSPNNETSRDILSEDVQQYSVNTFSNLNANPDRVTQNNKDPNPTLPSLPNSSECGKFDGLDLFSAPYAPQPITSAPPVIDLFESSDAPSALSVNSLQAQAFGPSSLDLFSIMPQQQSVDKSPDTAIQKNEGWATFDMPWHVEPSQGIKSSIPVSETSTSKESLEKLDQAPSLNTSSHWSFHQNFRANGPSSLIHNPWDKGVHDIGAPVSAIYNQSWSAFEESTTPFQSIYTQSSKQVPMQDPSVADPFLAWGVSEDLQNFKIKQDDMDTAQYAIGSLDSLCELPVLDGIQSRELDTKSRNPFDLPNDSDLESSNVFLDMSSLHSALPNQNISTPWFPESAAIPYTPNIQAPGPVASIGGNPFG